MSEIQSDGLRFKVYNAILEGNPDDFGRLIVLLDQSKKDFAFDKSMLIKEGLRLGMELPKISPFQEQEEQNILPFSQEVKNAV